MVLPSFLSTSPLVLLLLPFLSVLLHVPVVDAVVRITSQELYDGMQSGRWDVVIDVRSASEWANGHIENATFMDSLNQFGTALQKSTPSDLDGCQDCVIAVYCQSGRRAGIAADLLEANGFRKPIYNGLGTGNWVQAGFSLSSVPSVTPPCTVTNNSCPVTDIPTVVVTDLFRAVYFGTYDVVIDVRSGAEWAMGHIPNATHMENLAQFGVVGMQVSVPTDLGACMDGGSCRVVIYDADGGADAAVAAQILYDYGFGGTIHNGGGVVQWTQLYGLVNSSSVNPPCNQTMVGTVDSVCGRSRGSIVQLTSQEVMDGMLTNRFDVIADVRTQGEWDAGHLPNVTFLENLNSFGISNQATDPYTLGECQYSACHIVLYCGSGRRAEIAGNILLDAGFQGTIYNGQGVSQWVAAGFPLDNSPSVVPACIANGTTCSDSSMPMPSASPTIPVTPVPTLAPVMPATMMPATPMPATPMPATPMPVTLPQSASPVLPATPTPATPAPTDGSIVPTTPMPSASPTVLVTPAPTPTPTPDSAAAFSNLGLFGSVTLTVPAIVLLAVL